MKVAVLGSARVLYLALMGAAFFVAAARADPRELGVYALVSSYAALVVVALNLGLDRVIFIRAVQNPATELGGAVRGPRLGAAVLVILAMVVSGFRPEVIAAAAVIGTRLRLNDLEAFSLGRGQSHRVSVATLLNASISAPLTVLAAPAGAAWLLWASAIGNLLAFMSLQYGAKKGSHPSLGPVRVGEAWQFAAISLVGVLYLRGGMSLLPLRGLSPTEIASYAIAFKSFEFVVAARGALVQHLAADLVDRSKPHNTRAVLSRVTALAVGLSIAGLTASFLLERTRLLDQYSGVWILVALVAAFAPLIMPHAVTSAFVYSQPGRTVLLRDSVLLASTSLICVALAAGESLRLVVMVTCGMEFISFLGFSWRFRREGLELSAVTVAIPLIAASAPLALWGVMS